VGIAPVWDEAYTRALVICFALLAAGPTWATEVFVSDAQGTVWLRTGEPMRTGDMIDLQFPPDKVVLLPAE